MRVASEILLTDDERVVLMNLVRSSTSTRKFGNIMPCQLSIRILSSEVPLDGSSFLVAGLLPRIDFGFQKFSIGNAPIQALAAENSNLDLSHVQPARVLWCVVKLHATQELRGRAVAKHIVKALSEVSVQVIEHQVNSSRLGVCASEQVIDEGDEVNLSSTLGDRDDSLARFGLDGHEQVGGAVAHILVVLL